MCNRDLTSCGRPVSDKQILHIFFQSSFTCDNQSLPKRDGPEPSTTISGTSALWSWYVRCTSSWPDTFTWVSCVSVQASVGWTGGVSLKCLVYVSLEMKETPAPVSSSMKRGVPFSLTGTSMPLLPEPKLYSEVENGSTESWELTWEGSGSSTLLTFCGLLLHASVMWPALPQEWQV